VNIWQSQIKSVQQQKLKISGVADQKNCKNCFVLLYTLDLTLSNVSIKISQGIKCKNTPYRVDTVSILVQLHVTR
jgi:hypothetical protein